MKYKLVNNVLLDQSLAFTYFFEDFQERQRAPKNFIMKVLTQLTSVMFKPDDMIIEYRKKVSDLIVIQRGDCNLYGVERIDTGNQDSDLEKFHVVTLPEQSWFGDFQVLLDVESSFQLEAGCSRK